MRLTDLKKSFWGYHKESVHRYIIDLEKEISERFSEKNRRVEAELKEAAERIENLEKLLTHAQEENQELRNDIMTLEVDLAESQQYAEQMKRERNLFEQEEKERLDAVVQRQENELKVYGERIGRLRSMLAAALQDMNQTAEDFEQKILRLQEEKPKINLSLFQKKEDKGR